MASYLDSDALIASVKRRASIPTSQSLFTNDDFLGFANEEMDLGLVPLVLAEHEDYYLHETKVSLSADTTRYTIPYRAIGNKLQDLHFVDSQDNYFEMTRVTKGDVSDYNGLFVQSSYYAFYVEGNEVVIFNDHSSEPTGSLAFSYYLRPNRLVKSTRAATIQSIDTNTGEVTVDNVPDVFKLGEQYDFIKKRSPHSILAFDIDITGINASQNILTFSTSDLPNELAVGDVICLAEETTLPQAPSDTHSLLAERVAARCLEAMNDTEGLNAANQKIAELEQKMGRLIMDRVENAPKKVKQRHGFLNRKDQGYRGRKG